MTGAVSELSYIRTIGEFGRGEGQFNKPTGLAVDSSGNLYVADSASHRIQVFDAEGAFVRSFGSRGSGEGEWDVPTSMTFSPDGDLYVVDSRNDRIQIVDLEGEFVDEIAVPEFTELTCVAFDAAGSIYVCEEGSDEQHGLHQLSPDGMYLGFFGSAKSSAAGDFAFPRAVVFDSVGNAYISNTTNGVIQVFDADRNYLARFASRGREIGQLFGPRALALDHEERLYVVENVGDRVQVFDREGNSLFAYGTGERGDGENQFNRPSGIAFDGNTVYVSDTDNHRVKVLGIDASREVSPYDRWLTEHGLSTEAGEPGHDADSDGLPNLLEFAFGSKPNESDSVLGPVVTVKEGVPQVSLSKPAEGVWVDYGAEVSDDLIEWGIDGLTVVEDSESAFHVRIDGRISTAYVRLAVRLKAEQ